MYRRRGINDLPPPTPIPGFEEQDDPVASVAAGALVTRTQPVTPVTTKTPCGCEQDNDWLWIALAFAAGYVFSKGKL